MTQSATTRVELLPIAMVQNLSLMLLWPVYKFLASLSPDQFTAWGLAFITVGGAFVAAVIGAIRYWQRTGREIDPQQFKMVRDELESYKPKRPWSPPPEL